MITGIQYQFGLPESLRTQAARLYDQAFGAKFSVAVKDRDQRIRLISSSMLLPYAVAAISDDQLVGLAGFQTPAGSLTKGINQQVLFKQLGLFNGVRAALVFSLFEREAKESELLMDGIAVSKEMRGHGIGTQLLGKLKEFAKEQEFTQIRLDVIDTNSAAKRLYERQGFEETGTEHFNYLRGLLGFGAATTMVYRVS